MVRFNPVIFAIVALASCQASNADQSGPASPELEQLQQAVRQIKADDPDTARLLVRECATTASFASDEGKLEALRCMKRKYDEGVRAG